VSVSTNTDGTDIFRIPADFDGVAGTLSCSAGCAAGGLINDGGNLRGPSSATSIPAGTWRFTATNASATVAGINADYLAFGWWRESGTGDTIADFQPAYGGRVPYSDTTIASAGPGLTGKATYEGGAAGNYTMGTANTPERHGGWFVADAKITATFTNNSATGSPDDTIKGEISNFRGEHEELLDGWKFESTLRGDLDDGTFSSVVGGVAPTAGPPVDYSSATIVREGFATIPAGSVTAANYSAAVANPSGTAAGVSWDGGAWGGTFYGDDGSAGLTLPSGVAGWFHAHTADGAKGVRINGSFAATRQP